MYLIPFKDWSLVRGGQTGQSHEKHHKSTSKAINSPCYHLFTTGKLIRLIGWVSSWTSSNVHKHSQQYNILACLQTDPLVHVQELSQSVGVLMCYWQYKVNSPLFSSSWHLSKGRKRTDKFCMKMLWHHKLCVFNKDPSILKASPCLQI